MGLRGFLRRMDAHMAQANEQMARGAELTDELRTELRLNREERTRSEARYETLAREIQDRYDEQLRITREVVRRNELAFQAHGETVARLDSAIERLRESAEGLREDSKAHTRAIFALIDELRGGGPSPATT